MNWIIDKYLSAIWQDRRLAGLLLWPALWALWIANHGLRSFSMLFAFLLLLLLAYLTIYISIDVAQQNYHIQSILTFTPLSKNKVTLKSAYVLFILMVLYELLFGLFVNGLFLALTGAAFLAALLFQLMPDVKYKIQGFTFLSIAYVIFMPFTLVSAQMPVIAYVLALVALMIWGLNGIADRVFRLRTYFLLKFIKRDNHFLTMVVFQVIIMSLLIIVGIFDGLSVFYFLSLLGILGIYIYERYVIQTQKIDLYSRIKTLHQSIGWIIFLGIFLGY
ncbi:MAG: hypothetical protein A3C55_05560 [Gammaproteobacteria bacterium RIFCSPHIGHO2_02_FULL_42_13]|nr:MAG: hypothetical protein A3C55_05560 [Gammaproteobacteria bacterium RIFCSPHIGHO2_02_FULL_42_13]OGT68856.1 MAG: hypothetical protein A3H43_01080 [Gammaproteobacteria bacterium RIFCSPLOWO2_02_FULL_42_9]